MSYMPKDLSRVKNYYVTPENYKIITSNEAVSMTIHIKDPLVRNSKIRLYTDGFKDDVVRVVDQILNGANRTKTIMLTPLY